MAFVKLDCGILRSTLWLDRDCREIFITALLMAEPREFDAPQQQLATRTLELTGYSVPPDWYGFVAAAGVGIIGAAGLERETGMLALEKLASPDLESRSQDFDGRRLIRIDGGYLVLNFMKYRDRDYTGAARAQRYRERRANKAKAPSLKEDEWNSIVSFYGGLCAYCQANPWTDIDHIIPTSKGGEHKISNVAPACRSCNSSKKATTRSPARPHPYMTVTRDECDVRRDITQAECRVQSTEAEKIPSSDISSPLKASSTEPAAPDGAFRKRKSVTKARTQIPDGRWLTDDDRAFALERCPDMNIDATFDDFHNHHTAKGTLGADWHAGWRTWVGNCAKGFSYVRRTRQQLEAARPILTPQQWREQQAEARGKA
jgi:hypothetical protein